MGHLVSESKECCGPAVRVGYEYNTAEAGEVTRGGAIGVLMTQKSPHRWRAFSCHWRGRRDVRLCHPWPARVRVSWALTKIVPDDFVELP
jgi:hypothetical protein